MTEAVIFDLDDTLYSEKEYVKSGFRAVSKFLESVDDAYSKLWRAFENGGQAIDFLLHSEKIYSHELKARCLNIYRNHRPDIRLYGGVRELLISLKKNGTKTGIITDGRPASQEAKLEALGLSDGKLIDEVIITDSLGGARLRKPHSAAFEIIRERLGVPYENMAYVGDNWRKDYSAAGGLGIRFIYFRNADGLYREDIKANKSITAFECIAELREILLSCCVAVK